VLIFGCSCSDLKNALTLQVRGQDTAEFLKLQERSSIQVLGTEYEDSILGKWGHMFPDDARLGDLPARTVLNLALNSLWYLTRGV
jgi:hypothetical protein